MAPPPGGGFSVSVRPGATHYATYFSEELIRKTLTTVKTGEIAFMGGFVVDTNLSFEEADDVQMHYYRLLAPGDEDRGFLSMAFSGDYHYRGSLKAARQDESAREAFLESGRGKLVEAGWKLE